MWGCIWIALGCTGTPTSKETFFLGASAGRGNEENQKEKEKGRREVEKRNETRDLIFPVCFFF